MVALIRHVPIEPTVDFMRRARLMLAFSAVIVLSSLASLFTLGLNLGVDFRGGILIEIRTDGPAELGELRATLGGLGLGEVALQEFGAPTDVLINVERQAGEEAAQLAAIERIKEELGDRIADYRRIEFVGPKVGSELREAGAIATVLALLAIAAYIWFRFEWQFSIAALVALIHDVIATVGFFAVTQIEFNLATLAAVLAIAGYSINDTVVIFDRVREMLRKYKRMPLREVLNKSLNSTLTRSIVTSLTTLLALIALSVFGGPVIRGFSLGLIWGVAIGAYSSIGLAVPILSYFNLRGVGGAEDHERGEASAATDKA